MAWGDTGWGQSAWGASNPPAVPAAPVTTDQRDTYKAILLRRSLPHSYKRVRNSEVAKFLAVIGEIDNDIGGLFGDANFLVDENGLST